MLGSRRDLTGAEIRRTYIRQLNGVRRGSYLVPIRNGQEQPQTHQRTEALTAESAEDAEK